jgi:uracil-DNA glycosylase
MYDERPGADLEDRIRACALCAGRFAATATGHAPRPVVRFSPGSRILVVSQAPGLRAHERGLPFWDRSGDRLRDWMGLDRAAFYDRALVSVLPMAFCFPGYGPTGADLPPPALCARTWHGAARAAVGACALTLVVGGHAMRGHLGLRGPVGAALRGWRAHAPATFLLPHPSWRNNAWLRANPWFEDEVLPALRAAVAAVRG